MGKQNRGREVCFRTPVRKRGFTLIELLLVIVIIAIQAAILVPAVKRALQTAGRTQGMAGLHRFCLSIHVDFFEHDGMLPGPLYGGQGPTYSRGTPYAFGYSLWPYLDGSEPKRAASTIGSIYDARRQRGGYRTVYRRNGHVWVGDNPDFDPFGYPSRNGPSSMDTIPAPTTTWMMYDLDPQSIPIRPSWFKDLPEEDYHGLNIVLYFDSHAETFKKPDHYHDDS